ncbi:hypothetical protein ACFO0N_12465 [Halobium salinum]|uniref:DUF7310 domain-containing protein n=1 Tax=Halobium salinum TaxID=1364940 RepID=A0ABD5PDB9_9EURY|nr:hypothetical protein [Halobium salinum]
MPTDTSDLDRRLRAVERTLTDGTLDAGDGDADTRTDGARDHGLDALPERAALAARLGEVETQLETVESRLDELDAATQAVRGYVGGVRAVNRDVERRADAALAAVDRLERAMADGSGIAGDDGLSRAVAAARDETPVGESGGNDGGDGSDDACDPSSSGGVRSGADLTGDDADAADGAGSTDSADSESPVDTVESGDRGGHDGSVAGRLRDVL